MSSAAPPYSSHEGRRQRGNGAAATATAAGGGSHQGPPSSAASRDDLDKPNESWFLILVNAFKSNYEQTLTYKESELYEWIMKAYPYYRHDMHTMQTSVRTTLHSYECFRQSGRGTWTFIPRRALIHLENLKAEGDRSRRDGSYDQDHHDEDYDNDDDGDDDDDEQMAGEGGAEEYTLRQDHGPVAFEGSGAYTGQGAMASFDASKRPVPRRIPTDTREELMAEDSPTLTAEEIERFKQEHQEAAARKLKRKASTSEPAGRPWPRPRSRSPVKALEDECHMSMEAWCNLLVQMFEASPKQKTIREIFAWVHDNYPIYREAPDESWKTDLTAALESNPLFRPMGRGRWQMASPDQQPPAPTSASVVPVIIGSIGGVNDQGTLPSATTSTTAVIPTINQPAKEVDGDATDSPSVTEDEDWKAIGSKRLLNFGFRRYSIATDTVPKRQLKPGSAHTTGSTGPAHGSQARQSTYQATPTQSTGGLSPYGFTPHDQSSLPYSGGRRYSSFHQPTPKNSPPLPPQANHGLSAVPEANLDARGASAQSDETDEDEELTKRYMAPLHSAINAAILANNYPSHPNFASAASTPATLHASQFQHQQQPLQNNHHQQQQQQQQQHSHQYDRSSSVPRDLALSGMQDRRLSIPFESSNTHAIQALSTVATIVSSSAQGSSSITGPTIITTTAGDSHQASHSQPQVQVSHPSSVTQEHSSSAEEQQQQQQQQQQSQQPQQQQHQTPQQASARPDPEIVIPNGEALAGDQMAAIQALALLAGGG